MVETASTQSTQSMNIRRVLLTKPSNIYSSENLPPFEGKKEEEWLLMPLVTYTEGMPEFLEHQDTLCIRRRGTERYVKQAPK